MDTQEAVAKLREQVARKPETDSLVDSRESESSEEVETNEVETNEVDSNEIESKEVNESEVNTNELETNEQNSEEDVEHSSTEVEADNGAESIELEADQFADLLKLDPERLNIDDEGIKFRAKVDDKTVDVTLEQLLNAYQGDATLTNRAKEVAEIRKARETELLNLQQQTQQFAQQSANLLEGLKEQFLKPYEDINWKELKEDDPGQYAALKADQRATEETLSKIANQAIEQVNQVQHTQNEELQKQYREYLGEQEKMLMDSKSPLHIPNLEKSYSEIKAYMGNLGFSDQEQNQIADARLLSALYKAMMFDKGKKGAKEKLAKPMPKVLKPGKSPSKQDVSLEKTEKLKNKLKETGDWRDAVALLKTRS